jgi:hypothetical protein
VNEAHTFVDFDAIAVSVAILVVLLSLLLRILSLLVPPLLSLLPLSLIIVANVVADGDVG